MIMAHHFERKRRSGCANVTSTVWNIVFPMTIRGWSRSGWTMVSRGRVEIRTRSRAVDRLGELFAIRREMRRRKHVFSQI